MNSSESYAALAANSGPLHLAGGMANPFVEVLYPMAGVTAWHQATHLPGLTGRWMDTGATALGGRVAGSFHRLAHGHHLLEDGFEVLINRDLSFGEFLHHLGLDFLTRRGIPIPFIPKALAERLLAAGMRAGLSRTVMNELLTVNLPKVLGGSLGVVCSGSSVYLAFSDAIPHTFGSAAMHLGAAALDIAFGCYPPNPLLLLAGAMETGVSAATAWRAWVDPVIPRLGMPKSVFLPLLGKSVALSALTGGAGGLAFGGVAGGITGGVAGGAAGAAAAAVKSMATAAHLGATPLLGPLAGIGAFLVTRAMLQSLATAETTEVEWANPVPLEAPAIVPAYSLASRPVARLAGRAIGPIRGGMHAAARTTECVDPT